MLHWNWLIVDGYKPHAIPEYLVQNLVDDLQSRTDDKHGSTGPLSWEATVMHQMAIDQPGMVCVDRPWKPFHLDGLVIEIPCEDVASFLYDLRELKPRTFGKDGFTYYKLHGFTRCLVLTPDLYVDLIEALEAGLTDAETRAMEFYADRKPVSEILREVNAIANGVTLDDIGDCGGHKNDRFHPKKGEA